MNKLLLPVAGIVVILAGCDAFNESPEYSGNYGKYNHRGNQQHVNETAQVNAETVKTSGKPVRQTEVTATSLADPVSTAVAPPKHVVKTTAGTSTAPSVPSMAPTVD